MTSISNFETRRTFASAVLVTSIGCHFGIIPIRWFYFHYLEIFKLPPEIWRVITSFLLTGPGLAIIMDTYFVFQYLSQLETAHPKFNRREDLVWYLVVCGVTILVSVSWTPRLDPPVLLPLCRSSIFCPFAPRVSARIVHYTTAITVPEVEEDYPCTSVGPSFAIT